MFEDFTPCQNCENYDLNDRLCKLFRCVKVCGCSSGEKRKPRNYFEMLKNMSMEEMAGWLNKGFVCPPKHDCPKNEASCEKCWLEWLKEEVE